MQGQRQKAGKNTVSLREEKGRWKSFHKEEFQNFYFSQDNNMVIK